MSEFEFQRYITIGQHLPTGSIIHRLDPRTRLIGTAILLVTITLAHSLAGLALALVALLALTRLARIPLSYVLKGLLPPLPFILLLALLQVVLGPEARDSAPLWSWGFIRITRGGLLDAARLLLRFPALILVVTLFSASTSTTETVRGLETLLHPLARLGLPVQDLVLMIQVALRFLPLLAREAERIAKSQASRGAEWGTDGKGAGARLVRRIRQALPIIVPLLLVSLERGESMAIAMEARGYRSGNTRTSYVTLHFRPADALALTVCVVIAAFILVV